MLRSIVFSLAASLALLAAAGLHAVSAQTIFIDNFEPPRGSNGWTFLEIPDVHEGASLSGMRATNAGIYFAAERGDGTDWIYRHKVLAPTLQPWTMWPNDGDPDIRTFVPSRPWTEGVEEFAIFFHGWDRYGLIGVNTGTPAVLDHAVPEDSGHDFPDFMGLSGGKYPRYWAVYPLAFETNIKREGFDLAWEDIAVLDFPPSLVEGDPRESSLWLAGDGIVAKVDALGGVERFDFAALASANNCYTSVTKIRFSQHYTFFSAGPCIFRVDDADALTLLHVMQGFGVSLGEFAVGDVELFTAGGNVVRQDSGQVTGRYIPPMPTSDIDAILSWSEHNAVFQTGQLEMMSETGFLADRVFVLGLSQLLVVSVPFPLHPVSPAASE